jgi:hypothetical protein
VPDFAIFRDRTNADAWQVQGEYWHSLSRKQGHDRSVSLRMTGAWFQGRRIWKVAELWEADLLDTHNRDVVCRLALQGISTRQA